MSSNLRIPGPTPLPPRVVAAMQRPMIPHRGPAFKDLYRTILKLARAVHRTDGDVLLWPASGSGGWEAAVVNLLSPGDPVLAVVTGDFGDRTHACRSALLPRHHRRGDVSSHPHGTLGSFSIVAGAQ